MGKSICSKVWCYVWERPLYEKTALWVSVTATDPHPHSISVPPSFPPPISFLPILLLSHVFFFFFFCFLMFLASGPLYVGHSSRSG